MLENVVYKLYTVKGYNKYKDIDVEVYAKEPINGIESVLGLMGYSYTKIEKVKRTDVYDRAKDGDSLSKYIDIEVEKVLGNYEGTRYVGSYHILESKTK